MFSIHKLINIFVIAAFLFTGVAVADSDYVEVLIKRADEAGLADSRAWRALVHYKPGVLFNDWESQADDVAFFLSAEGKFKPDEELAATIRAMAAPDSDADQHPQCRFSARYNWLKKQLAIDPEKLKPVECPELNEWFETIRPGSLTLVFPSAYINSPSSMFGHTLLRVNPDDFRKHTPLAAYALNYAADANAADSALTFSIKGLIGGYPGNFSIVPYYEKIKEYSDLENRDIWEYELNFTKDEVDQLMRHAWEVRHIRFDYYFLTENCSYHMLSLMEAARPELDLTSQFDIKAIPADTVRAVANAGLVTSYRYRPSSTTILTQHAAQMSAEDNASVLAITRGEVDVEDRSVAGRAQDERARIYEQAYDYSRFLSTANPSVRDNNASTNWKLLAARSQIAGDEVWLPIDEPVVKPEKGHDTARIAYVLGRLDSDAYAGLSLRPAYHDVLDPPAGYSPGAQINFMDLRLDYYSDEDALRLDRFILINVLSLSPVTEYFTPISWGINIGVERVPTSNGMTQAARVTADGGYSIALPAGWTGSFLLQADVRGASRYDEKYSAGAGATVSLLRQSDVYSVRSSYNALAYRYGEEADRRQFDIELSWHVQRLASMRLGFTRLHYYDSYSSRTEISYHMFF